MSDVVDSDEAGVPAEPTNVNDRPGMDSHVGEFGALVSVCPDLYDLQEFTGRRLR